MLIQITIIYLSLFCLCWLFSGAGVDWVCAATSFNNLYLFSSSGIHEEILSIPGNIVTVCGRGRMLCVVYSTSHSLTIHPQSDSDFDSSSSTMTTTNSLLKCWILDVVTKEKIVEVDVPISPSSSLSWVSFSNNNSTLITMDSSGIVRSLVKTFGWIFTPICDTKILQKTKKDSFWPISFTNKGMLIGVELRGGRVAPETNPRPVTTSLPLSFPMCSPFLEEERRLVERSFKMNQLTSPLYILDLNLSLDREMGLKHEEQLERLSLEMDKNRLMIIKECCMKEQVDKAIQHSQQLTGIQSMEAAQKIANHFSLPILASRLDKIIQLKELEFEESESEEYSDQEEEEEKNYHTQSSRTSTPTMSIQHSFQQEKDEEDEEEEEEEYDEVKYLKMAFLLIILLK